MNYFNLNAFILGTLLFTCVYLSNVVYSLLCLFYKIRIVEFSLFFSPWFSLHKKMIMGTEFSLGWLPLGGFIKPFGMSVTHEEKKEFSETELPFAFFKKPKYLRVLFHLVPWLIYISAFFISYMLFTGFTNGITEWKYIFEYIIKAFETLFGNELMRENFINSTTEMIAGKSTVLFGFMLLTFIMLLFTPFANMTRWFPFSNHEKKKPKIQKILGFICITGFSWFMFWKIYTFIFSFFTFSQSVTYIISGLGGMFSVGLIYFCATLFVVKIISRNLNDNKIT